LILAQWTGPSGNPPDNNVMAPLNQGTTPQFKDSGLHIGDSDTMGGYMFSVINGASYFEDLEVGGMATITASNGSFETEGNVILQGGHLLINDSGTLTAGGLILNGALGVGGNNISIITGESGVSILVNNDNTATDSVAISADIPNGTAILGSTNQGIGIFGSTINSLGLAGRFDGEVRFNSINDSTFTEITGGTAIFDDGGKETTISSLLINIEEGDIILESGDIWVKNGVIDMFLNHIVNLKYPVEDLDAANKEYVDDKIGALADDDGDWDIIDENTIYKLGVVGIGTAFPEYALDVMGQLGIGCNDSVSNNPENAIRIGDAGFIYDSSCDGGTCPGGQCQPKTFHIDAEEDIIIQSDGYVAIKGGGFGVSPGNYGIHVKSDGNVGIGTSDPYLDLTVAETANPAYIGILNTDTSITNGTSLGSLMFLGTDSHGIAPASGAAIEVEAMGTWGSDRSDSPARLKFYTQSSGVGNGFNNPAVIIDENGDTNVIGDLQVGKDDDSNTATIQRIDLNQNGVGGNLVVKATDASCDSCTTGGGGFAGGDLYVYGGDDWDNGGEGDIILSYTEAGLLRGGVVVGAGSVSAGLKLDVEGKIGATEYCDEDGNNCSTIDSFGSLWSGGTGNEIYYNETAGYVGIGTSDPIQLLHVNGEVKIEDILTVSGDIEAGDIYGTDIFGSSVDISALSTIDIDTANISVSGVGSFGGSIETDSIVPSSVTGAEIEFDGSGNVIITIP
jgi:hypothetical protein